MPEKGTRVQDAYLQVKIVLDVKNCDHDRGDRDGHHDTYERADVLDWKDYDSFYETTFCDRCMLERHGRWDK